VKNAAALRQRQAKLQISSANALIATRGYGAAETTAAFARARELTMGIEDSIERFSVLYGLLVGTLVRGELPPMRETADAFCARLRGGRCHRKRESLTASTH
jgi:hypothetical protein